MPRMQRAELWLDISKKNISQDVDVIVTDELAAYPKALGELSDRHETVNHTQKEYVRSERIFIPIQSRTLSAS